MKSKSECIKERAAEIVKNRIVMQEINSTPVDPMIEVCFTAQLKRKGLMKWFEDRGWIKPYTEDFQIFSKKVSCWNYISSLQGDKSILSLYNIKISSYPTIKTTK